MAYRKTWLSNKPLGTIRPSPALMRFARFSRSTLPTNTCLSLEGRARRWCARRAYRASVWSRCSECSPVGIEERKERAMLALIGRAQFDAFITNDKKMGAEGQLSRRPFAILILSATSWNLIKPHVGNIADALEAAKPGEVAGVDVGRLGRKPDPPTARQTKMHRCPESYLLGKTAGNRTDRFLLHRQNVARCSRR
jgi:hypothetical protein